MKSRTPPSSNGEPLDGRSSPLARQRATRARGCLRGTRPFRRVQRSALRVAASLAGGVRPELRASRDAAWSLFRRNGEFQIPASFIADRVGVRTMLTVSAAIGGAAYCLAGASVGFASLIACLLVGGLAASIQHPVASALVARAYEGARSRTALGTYNFAGDVGKMAFPALTSVILVLLPWRPTIALIGLLGIFAAVLIFRFTPTVAEGHLV